MADESEKTGNKLISIWENKAPTLQKLRWECAVASAGLQIALAREKRGKATRDTVRSASAAAYDAKTQIIHARKVLRDKIERVVSPDTDPLELLCILFATSELGERATVQEIYAAYEQLQELRERLLHGQGEPMAIVGTNNLGELHGNGWDASLVIGRAMGEMIVRDRATEEANHLAAASDLVVEIPLENPTGFAQGYLSADRKLRTSTGWEAGGADSQPSPICQDLAQLRIAYSAEQVRRLAEIEVGDALKTSENDYDRHLYYNLKVTGMPPLVAVGTEAVTEVFRIHYAHFLSLSITEQEQTRVDEFEIYIAALRAGIDPAEIVPATEGGISPSEIKDIIRKRVINDIRFFVENTILLMQGGASEERIAEQGVRENHIAVDPTVLAYSGLSQNDIVEEIKAGIEEKIGCLKTVRLDDIASSIKAYETQMTNSGSQDARLTQYLVAERLAQLMQAVYGLKITFHNLMSDELETKMRERLERIKEEYQTSIEK